MSFTWRTDKSEPESIVTVLLAPHAEGQTHMTIIHSRQLAALVEGYCAGWTSIADRLAGYLAG